MKKFLQIFVVTMTMVIVMPCTAQSTRSNMGATPLPNNKTVSYDFKFYEMPGVQNMYEFVIPDGYETVTKNGITTYVEKDKARKQKSLKAENEGIAVTCVFDCDMAAWKPYAVIAYNNVSLKREDVRGNGDFVTLNLEAGTYDFLALYHKLDETSMYYQSYDAWVIKENVEISGETTLSFDPNTATNHISMRSYNPNGEPTCLKRIKYDIFSGPVTLEEGNVHDVAMLKSINHEDYGTPFIIFTNFGGVDLEFNPDMPYMGQWNSQEWVGDIYVNDVSDKYMFQEFRLMTADDETYSTVIRAKCSDTWATNDYTEYAAPLQFRYTNSPSREKYNINDVVGNYGISISQFYNKQLLGSMGLRTNAEPRSIYNIRFCPPSSVPEYDNLIDFGFQYNFVDACVSDTTDYGDGDIDIQQQSYQITSQYIFAQTSNFEWKYSTNQTTPLDNPTPDESIYATGVDGLNFDYLNSDLAAGGTCPIAKIGYYQYPYRWWDGSIRTDQTFYYRYEGQMGEQRSADILDATFELKVNDEIVASTRKAVNNWMSSNANNPAKLTLSMTNRNFMVDDIEGFNDMVIEFDQNKEDHYSPMLTALQFRRADGFVTNRFDNANNGTMSIMCGDFNEQINADNYYWFEYGDCDVTVEYAPNGTDYFLPIAMTKDDSKFHMPKYGAYYSASLDAFTEHSINGWYDLRITLKDAAGNYQQQVISPAVRIGDGTPSSIKAIESDTATEVARYTIDGRIISAPQPGVNIVKMSDGSVKKVLVK